MGELRRAGVWGQKRLGRRRTLSTGYRDLESCQEKVRAGGRLCVWGVLFWDNAWGRQNLRRRRKLRV